MGDYASRERNEERKKSAYEALKDTPVVGAMITDQEFRNTMNKELSEKDARIQQLEKELRILQDRYDRLVRDILELQLKSRIIKDLLD